MRANITSSYQEVFFSVAKENLFGSDCISYRYRKKRRAKKQEVNTSKVKQKPWLQPTEAPYLTVLLHSCIQHNKKNEK